MKKNYYNISIIIPFLNEQENIEVLVNELSQFCIQNNDISWEVIFVDDGSKDKSVEILLESDHKGYVSKIIRLSKNYGSHAALRAGILQSSATHTTFAYADLQDPLSVILDLYKEAKKDNEIVWANRSSTKLKFLDNLFSLSYAYLMQNYVVNDFPLKGFDIVMFGQKVKKELNKNIEANSSIFLQILIMGFKQCTISYHKKERKMGKSKWTFKKKIKLFIDSFVAFSFFPIRMVTIVGFSLFVIGSFFAIFLIIRKLVFNDLEQGWAALISILMLGFGISNISLGIIAEYLWRTLDASRKRPVFIVDEIIDLNQE